ncbi:sulfur carrier protein ThiS [Eubacteriaceae bacterium ES2]|nr:sulfur carrier protein ThiS [Eubacteriaceae bacterium ES2]
MRFNGIEFNLDNPIPLREFLRDQAIDSNGMGLVVNGQVITACDYDQIILVNDDQLELVRFVGGG